MDCCVAKLVQILVHLFFEKPAMGVDGLRT